MITRCTKLCDSEWFPRAQLVSIMFKCYSNVEIYLMAVAVVSAVTDVVAAVVICYYL